MRHDHTHNVKHQPIEGNEPLIETYGALGCMPLPVRGFAIHFHMILKGWRQEPAERNQLRTAKVVSKDHSLPELNTNKQSHVVVVLLVLLNLSRELPHCHGFRPDYAWHMISQAKCFQTLSYIDMLQLPLPPGTAHKLCEKLSTLIAPKGR